MIIPDPHTGEARNTHECQQDHAWSSSRECKYSSDENSVDVSLAQGGRDSETTDKKHNRRGKHDREDPSKCTLSAVHLQNEESLTWLHPE